MSTAIYLRVARNERRQLDTQTQQLHDYVAEHNLAVVPTFYDVSRGSGRDRPGLSQMLATARAGRFNRLLVNRLDRLSRTAHDLAGILDDLDHDGITLHQRDHHDHPRRAGCHPQARRHPPPRTA
jgi:DNA invertase Pin-like site-specific DNA recombinase